MHWEEAQLVLVLVGDTESERNRKPASVLESGSSTNPCNLAKLAVDIVLVLLVFNVSNQHWEGPGQVTTGNKERSHSAILLHYSSASSRQARKLTSNHQKKKKNCPKCYSWDFNQRARLAWEPQELGINVICGYVNFSAVIPITKLSSER